METFTFYSYKGGTGRSLALANAAVYLAALGFKVVALDFDLEAPGLHYKLSRNEDGSPLEIKKGLVDYINDYREKGNVDMPLTGYTVDVPVPGVRRSLVVLFPAGRVPSYEYWSKLARVNWHELFYSQNPKGVQIFMELKARISEELEPDFLLIDARTGITEMGGVATTLFADHVICLVLPTPEDLQGARAVMRSLKRSRRKAGASEPKIMIALSRLPQKKDAEEEGALTQKILAELNAQAEDPKDTLQCAGAFVLHSERALLIQESLRIGSGISPDDSVLLRDYLRLFASFVPKELVEPKVRGLIEKAWEKIRDDPAGAVKDMEQLAESFGRPEVYRELLRFYEVRNLGGTATLKRAERLWELTRDSGEPALWKAITASFDPRTRWHRPKEWAPNLDFVRAVWRDAGKRNSEFAMTLAEAYSYEDRESDGADVLLEVIKDSEATGSIVSRCIALLDVAKRSPEADDLIRQRKSSLGDDAEFVTAWARHALRQNNKEALHEITQPPVISRLREASPALALIASYRAAGLTDEVIEIAEPALREAANSRLPRGLLLELAEIFRVAGRFDDFAAAVRENYPDEVYSEIREVSKPRRLRR